MRKVLLTLLLTVFAISSVACGPYSDPADVENMFNSFEQADNYILLTHLELVVRGEHYLRSDIKYMEKEMDILFLEESGFYSYVFDPETAIATYLFTIYDGFETTKLGDATVPSDKVINAFFGDGCFWFRIDDPTTDEFEQCFFCWNTSDKTACIVDDVTDDYEYSKDNNRTKEYTFETDNYYDDNNNDIFNIDPDDFNEYMTVTKKSTGEEKVFSKEVLGTFREGLEIRAMSSSTYFAPRDAYIVGEDIYIPLSFGVGMFADIEYYYIVKWNFEIEECTFFTWTRFEPYQYRIDDFIILEE